MRAQPRLARAQQWATLHTRHEARVPLGNWPRLIPVRFAKSDEALLGRDRHTVHCYSVSVYTDHSCPHSRCVQALAGLCAPGKYASDYHSRALSPPPPPCGPSCHTVARCAETSNAARRPGSVAQIGTVDVARDFTTGNCRQASRPFANEKSSSNSNSIFRCEPGRLSRTKRVDRVRGDRPSRPTRSRAVENSACSEVRRWLAIAPPETTARCGLGWHRCRQARVCVRETQNSNLPNAPRSLNA